MHIHLSRRMVVMIFLMVFTLALGGCAAGGDPAVDAGVDTGEATPAGESGTVQEADQADEDAAAEPAAGDAVTTDSGLQYIEEAAGTGREAEPDTMVSVHYTGMLDDGTVFDSSYDRGQPFSFVLGRGQVIPGWDEGIDLMAVGGKARLIIPSELAYGDAGAGGVIPPGATLTFDVELMDVQDGPPGSPDAPAEVEDADYVTTDSGLMYADLVEGDGATAETGKIVSVHYTGWLEDGTKFDSSLDRGEPFTFPLGAGQVIPGWDQGVAGMQVGGQRQLVIPADLAYGDAGAGGVIPPGATLIFDVELLDVQ